MGKIRNFWIRKNRVNILKKKNKLKNIYSFFKLSGKFRTDKKYSLILSSRSLLSVSNKLLRSTTYTSYFNHFRISRVRKKYIKRLYPLRIFLANKKYFLLAKKIDNVFRLPKIINSPKRYQFRKLKHILYRNYFFSKVKRRRFKKKFPSVLHLLSALSPNFSIVHKVLPIWLKSHKKIYSIFKLFLFSRKRLRRRRRRKLKNRNKFYKLYLLSRLYKRKNFSFNLFRRTAKCLAFIKRKKLINQLLPFNKNYNRKKRFSLLKRTTYGFEVRGHRGPTSAAVLHRYKFILLKQKKRVRYKFIKFHLLYPIITHYSYYRRMLAIISKPRKRRRVWKRRVKVNVRATLRAAKFYYYKLHYLTRSYIPFKRRFFKKKKKIEKYQYYLTSSPIKSSKKIYKRKHVFLIKNFVRTSFFNRLISRKIRKLNKKVNKKYKKYKFLYKILYKKFSLRRRTSKKLYILNKNTGMLSFPILKHIPLKSFNLLLFLKPKSVISFFKERFSHMIRFFKQFRFIDTVFFSRVIKLLSLSIKRLQIIQKKNLKFNLKIEQFKNFKDDLYVRKNTILSSLSFLSHFIGVLKKPLIYKKTPRISMVPKLRRRLTRAYISERRRKLRAIGLLKQSLLAKQKRRKIDSLLRRRKDVWLQRESIMLNFKNLLIKNGLGVKAERLVSNLLKLTKFKRARRKINFVKLFLYRRPLFGSKPRRKGSMIQQIPMLLTSKRSISQGQRQLLKFAASRSERTLISRVYNECISTMQNRSSSSKALAEQYRSTFLNRVLL